MGWAFSLLLLLLLLGAQACQPEPPLPDQGVYAKGVLVVNEGIFGNTSGTLTHYDRSTGATTSSIFKAANGRDLGDVVQSLTIHEDKAYVVVNNSNKIEVADAGTFKEVAQITGLRLPRYLVVTTPGEAFVTEWGSDGRTGTLARLDLTQNTVAERIPVSMGPEHLVHIGTHLYMTHPGGLGINNQVTSYAFANGQTLRTYTVDDRPSGLVKDDQNRIWVACAGKVEYTIYPNIDVANSTESALIAIDHQTEQIVFRRSFGKGNPIGNLTINAQSPNWLYYTREGKVWAYDTQTDMEQVLFVGNYYGLGYDPGSGYLYAATSAGTNPATIERRRPNDGSLVDQFTAGTFANGFVFLPQ